MNGSVALSPDAFREAALAARSSMVGRTQGLRGWHMCCNLTHLTTRRWGHWRDLLSAIMPALEDYGLLVQGDVHMFGIAMGSAIDVLMEHLDPGRKKSPKTWKTTKGLRQGGTLATPPRSWWGYDSFEGLPETVGSERVPEWSKGAYAHDPRQHYLRRYGSDMAFVPGFYGKSLTAGLAAERRMRPAMYIDIDCDLYSSTLESLDWAFASKIAVPGTVIGFDDWWNIPCGPTDEATSPVAVGEGRALAEVSRKYGVELLCMAGPCRYMLPRTTDETSLTGPWSLAPNLHTWPDAWGVLMLVVSVGDPGRASTGHEMNAIEEGQFKKANNDCKKNARSGGFARGGRAKGKGK